MAPISATISEASKESLVQLDKVIKLCGCDSEE